MKMFVHTINTWLVAHLLHPFLFVIYSLLSKNSEESYHWGLGFFFIPVFSFFASIPSLFIAWFFQYIITQANFSLVEKYIAWIISVVVAIFLNFTCLELLFSIDIGGQVYEIILPSVIAAVASVLIRHKQFFGFHVNYKHIRNENNGF